MGDVLDDIEALDALIVQEVDRVRVHLAEDGHEHVAAIDLFLA